jgi:hypothetical protein
MGGEATWAGEAYPRRDRRAVIQAQQAMGSPAQTESSFQNLLTVTEQQLAPVVPLLPPHVTKQLQNYACFLWDQCAEPMLRQASGADAVDIAIRWKSQVFFVRLAAIGVLELAAKNDPAFRERLGQIEPAYDSKQIETARAHFGDAGVAAARKMIAARDALRRQSGELMSQQMPRSVAERVLRRLGQHGETVALLDILYHTATWALEGAGGDRPRHEKLADWLPSLCEAFADEATHYATVLTSLAAELAVVPSSVAPTASLNRVAKVYGSGVADAVLAELEWYPTVVDLLLEAREAAEQILQPASYLVELERDSEQLRFWLTIRVRGTTEQILEADDKFRDTWWREHRADAGGIVSVLVRGAADVVQG